jgi:hypothetical protein
VSTGFYGRRVLVPVFEAETRGEALRVPYDKGTIRDTPSASETEIDEPTERELYRHYGVSYSQHSSPSGLPSQVDVSVTEARSAHFATRWAWQDEGRIAAASTRERSVADELASQSADMTAETAAPFPTMEPAAATAPDNTPTAARDTNADRASRSALDDAPVVMSDKPADLPGTLYDTSPGGTPGRESGARKLIPVLAVAGAVIAGLLLLKRRRASPPDD